MRSVRAREGALRDRGYYVNRAATGVAVWHFATNGGAIAPMIEAGGLLIGGDMSGNLYAFRPTR